MSLCTVAGRFSTTNNKMEKRWENYERMMLATNLIKYPELYNMKSQDYGNTEKCRIALSSLKQDLIDIDGLTIAELKKQIKAERDYHRHLRTRVKKSALTSAAAGLGDDAVYKPTWFLWDTYQYLDDDNPSAVSLVNSYLDYASSMPKDATAPAITPPSPKRPKLTNSSAVPAFQHIIGKYDSLKPSHSSDKEDEWDIFCKDIANDIRRLPAEKRWEAKVKIRRCVEDLFET